jgi:hypothetical protein
MSRTDHHRPWQIRAEDRTDKNGPAYWSDLLECWTIPYSSLVQPPRWFRRHVWQAAERQREVRDLTCAARQYNTDGELMDDDFPNFHHHHCARALWS